MLYKLSDYAKKFNVTYRTAWNRYHAGKIDNSFMDEYGHIYIRTEELSGKRAAIYSRVSNNDRKDNLDRQSERLLNYSISNGYNVIYNVKEIASGLNDSRKKLINLFINANDYDVLIVENKDRLTRFGFNYIEQLLALQNKKIIVVNKVEDDKTDLIQDMVSILYSFSARIYGLRKRKNKEEIIKFLEN